MRVVTFEYKTTLCSIVRTVSMRRGETARPIELCDRDGCGLQYTDRDRCKAANQLDEYYAAADFLYRRDDCMKAYGQFSLSVLRPSILGTNKQTKVVITATDYGKCRQTCIENVSVSDGR